MKPMVFLAFGIVMQRIYRNMSSLHEAKVENINLSKSQF